MSLQRIWIVHPLTLLDHCRRHLVQMFRKMGIEHLCDFDDIGAVGGL